MKRLLLIAIAGCGPIDVERLESSLNADERRARCEVIRDISIERSLTNAVLLAGIGDAETNLAHCWSEATWACQGPDSTTCGGPVIAGAGDGPCELQQGGLGLFQFDGGTFDQTLARDGEEILLLEGNVSHAVDFVIGMVLRSEHVSGIEDEAQALAWMNSIPIELGHPDYEAWVSTVTHYYNGCAPTFGCWDERRARYDGMTRGIYDEMGADFWMAPEPQPCLPIPAEGGVIEENDPCYDDAGPLAAWRTADAGHGGRLRWTFAFDNATPENFGVWSLEMARAGEYLIEVYTDRAFAESRRAKYLVTHEGAIDTIEVDQSAQDGWQTLGAFSFAAGGGQSIRLDDNTGEPLSDQHMLVFDAIRLTPIEEAPIFEPVVPHASLELPAPDPIIPTEVDPMSEEGGCACVRPDRSSPVWIAVPMLLGALLRRRRS